MNSLKLPISTFLKEGDRIINEILDIQKEDLGELFTDSLREQKANDLELQLLDTYHSMERLDDGNIRLVLEKFKTQTLERGL